MSELSDLTRRRFLVGTAVAAISLPLDAQTNAQGEFVMPPPRPITGGTHPLMEGHTARPLRYKPVDGDFVIRNGGEFFNRPLYGQNINFRVDAGDQPEFSLYLANGHGGNLRLGLATAGGSRWLWQMAEVVARYRPGRMIYEIKDTALGQGTLRIEALTLGKGAGLMLRIDAPSAPPGVFLTWAFGGVSGRRGARNGDIGCENQPVSQFFQVRREECDGNRFTLANSSARVQAPAAELALTFPVGSQLAVVDADSWSKPVVPNLPASSGSQQSILTGWARLTDRPTYLAIQQTPADQIADWPAAFAARSAEVAAIAATLKISTPDPYIDAVAPALGIAGDALWDSAQECVMHGCVAWRAPLAGWRGPYSLATLGSHDRMRRQVRRWVKRQNLKPIATPDAPAEGPPDPDTHLARKEQLLHQNGDISGNHYDMNMVFFDVFLRWLRWTGDVEFAREIWPAFQRHLAWEQRLFRRNFDGLPLYEAYATIWASDNLQYNGGGATHATAYNLFAFRAAAQIARFVGDDPAPYEKEAALIAQAIEKLLWLPEQGAYAESKDILGKQTVYTNPALWTVYHTIDSEVPTPRQAWQMASERLAALRKIPVHGPDVPAGDWYMLSCSDWVPYLWSLNLLCLGENAHTALALWQAGLNEEAYRLFKGNVLDSLFMGLCPGDFHMSSELDAHRQEAQRDFGDPIGMTGRALVEGLFGLQPDLLSGRLTIRPGFPREWDHASISHPDLDFSWKRDGMQDSYEIASRLPKTVPLTLRLRALTTSVPKLSAGTAAFDPEAVGAPVLVVALPAAKSWKLTLEWHGDAPAPAPAGRAASFVDRHWPAAAQAISAKLRPDPVDLSSVLRHQIDQIFTRAYTAPRSPYCSLSLPEQLQGGWANMDSNAKIDAAGLRAANGTLQTPLGVPFRTPAGNAPNCLFVSQWNLDKPEASIPLSGHAAGIYLLMTGVTFPQCSRMDHGRVTVEYMGGGHAELSLRTPETWWPVEQDYLLDDYLAINNAPLPPRVDLRTGQTRILEAAAFKGKGRPVPGGAATILYLPLDATKQLAALKVEAALYGIVIALLAATLARPAT